MALLLSGCASKGNNPRGEDNLERQSNVLSALMHAMELSRYNNDYSYDHLYLFGLWSPVR